jgi:hypothetical protein
MPDAVTGGSPVSPDAPPPEPPPPQATRVTENAIKPNSNRFIMPPDRNGKEHKIDSSRATSVKSIVVAHGDGVLNTMVSIDFGRISFVNLTQGTNILYRWALRLCCIF